MAAFACLVVALILIRHRSNVARLLAGTENKIGRRRAAQPSAPEPSETSEDAQA
jgi:hypothetical protein